MSLDSRVLLIASALASATALLAACGESNTRITTENLPADGAGTFEPVVRESSDPMDLSQQLKYSTADLAERLGIEPQSITLMGVRKVNWRSGALGCPSQGMSYTEALVPGVLILLESNGVSYGYHAKTDGEPFYCPRERVEQPASIQAEDLA